MDRVVGDTVKGGIAGVLISALAGSLALPPATAIAAVVIIAPFVYSIVSATIDHVYQRFLGGETILAARRAHSDYLQTAAMIERDLVPRIRRLNQVGNLVGVIHVLDMDDATRTRVRQDARRCLDALAGTAHDGTRERANRDEYERYLLTFLSLRLKKQLIDGKAEPIVSASEIAHLSKRVHDIYWRNFAFHDGFKSISQDEVWRAVAESERLETEGGHRYDAIRALVLELAALEKFRRTPEEPILFRTRWEGYVGGRKHEEEYKLYASDALELGHLLMHL